LADPAGPSWVRVDALVHANFQAKEVFAAITTTHPSTQNRSPQSRSTGERCHETLVVLIFSNIKLHAGRKVLSSRSRRILSGNPAMNASSLTNPADSIRIVPGFTQENSYCEDLSFATMLCFVSEISVENIRFSALISRTESIDLPIRGPVPGDEGRRP